MLNIIKKSFKILKNNLLFIQPLLLFILIVLSAASYCTQKIITLPAQLVISISFVLLFVAFIAGWFYINNLAVNDYDENDGASEITAKTLNNIRKFFEGIGAKFLNILFAFVIISAFCLAAGYGLYKFCWHFYGEPSVIYQIPKIANAVSQAERLNLINSIPLESQIVLVKWFCTINSAAILITYVANLYLTVVTSENENFFKSLIKTVVFFFKNILGSIFIIFFLQILYLLVNLISMIAGIGIISLLITIMLFTAYLNYGVLLLFCFYNEKSKDNSNNRAECIGEN